jgi:predicted nucleotidyltransferase
MNWRRSLVAHQAERDALLQRARRMVEQDARICAAWLFGSLGRGDADALSDIDLFLVIEDADQAQVVQTRYQMMAQLAEPVLILEAPQNWPPGGIYNMAHVRWTAYPCESALTSRGKLTMCSCCRLLSLPLQTPH